MNTMIILKVLYWILWFLSECECECDHRHWHSLSFVKISKLMLAYCFSTSYITITFKLWLFTFCKDYTHHIIKTINLWSKSYMYMSSAVITIICTCDSGGGQPKVRHTSLILTLKVSILSCYAYVNNSIKFTRNNRRAVLSWTSKNAI